MNELQNTIWIEKYRPQKFEDLILENKNTILKYLDKPKLIPSFIFYSSSPGTGKTSTSKIIIKYLQCDFLLINSSDERGIDTIREKIKLFAMSLSSTDNKRCVFLDEAEGMTRQAQDSLRNLMETYSANCFFIFSCNDLNKIIEPLRSRCVVVNFERPNKTDIEARLLDIMDKENLSSECNIEEFIDLYYPDIRSMIIKLQEAKLENKKLTLENENFSEFYDIIKRKEIRKVYEIVYSGNFPLLRFNNWLFHKIFKDYNRYKKPNEIKLCKIVNLLADTEKHWNLGANIEVVFIANILKLIEII